MGDFTYTSVPVTPIPVQAALDFVRALKRANPDTMAGSNAFHDALDAASQLLAAYFDAERKKGWPDEESQDEEEPAE